MWVVGAVDEVGVMAMRIEVGYLGEVAASFFGWSGEVEEMLIGGR